MPFPLSCFVELPQFSKPDLFKSTFFLCCTYHHTAEHSWRKPTTTVAALTWNSWLSISSTYFSIFHISSLIKNLSTLKNTGYIKPNYFSNEIYLFLEVFWKYLSWPLKLRISFGTEILLLGIDFKKTTKEIYKDLVKRILTTDLTVTKENWNCSIIMKNWRKPKCWARWPRSKILCKVHTMEYYGQWKDNGKIFIIC